MSRRFLLFLAAFAAFFVLPQCAPLHAQVSEAAVGDVPRLWVGGEYLNFRPDWGIPRLPGLGIYGDIGPYHRRYGLEGEARFLNFTKPGGLTEKSYLGGATISIWRHGRFSATGKLLVGAGLITYTNGIGYGSYFAFVPGGNVEYRLAQRLKARFDYEYEFMPSAPNLPGYPNNGLTPSGFGAGLSYRIF